ncbi:MAG: hypothetical protein RLZZ259_1108, partial [Pseudomonadota bacterium]
GAHGRIGTKGTLGRVSAQIDYDNGL